MTDEQLIELVKRYPVLYDMSSVQYRDHNIRNNAWDEIAVQLNTTVEDSKERWGKLRNCFTNALKRHHKKSGQATTNIVRWKYESQMEFLLPHVAGRRTITNLSTDIDDSTQDSQLSEEPESPRTITTPLSSGTLSDFSEKTPMPSSKTRTRTSSLSRTFNRNTKENKNNIENNNNIKELVDEMKSFQKLREKRMAEIDETDHFFLSMSKQLKKLPKIDQTNIKFQMHKLINDAEVNMIKKSEQILRTPLSVNRNSTNTVVQMGQNTTNKIENEMNTQNVCDVVFSKTAPNIIQNQTIKYPNTSFYLNTNIETVNAQNETNNDLGENVLLYETAPTPDNIVEIQDITQEIENETENTSLKEYYCKYLQ